MRKLQGLSGDGRGKTRRLLGGLAAVGVLLAGCLDPLVRDVFDTRDTGEPGSSGGPPADTGDACVPEDEDYATFSGFSVGEINVSTDDPRCSGGTCLVNRFQGRVTCPEGNQGDDECYTPQGELVSVPVEPQLPALVAANAVYCSCRCAGPAAFAPFCECPSDMVCEDLFNDASRPAGPILDDGMDFGYGSYCVKR